VLCSGVMCSGCCAVCAVHSVCFPQCAVMCVLCSGVLCSGQCPTDPSGHVTCIVYVAVDFARELSAAIYQIHDKDKDVLQKWLADHGVDPASKNPQ
jgi:hypothetical protein